MTSIRSLYRLFLIPSIILALTSASPAQDSLRVTSTGMAGISINTPISQLAAKNIVVPATMDSSEWGMLSFTSKVGDYVLLFEVYELWQEDKPSQQAVYSMYTEDARARTPSGIGMGSDKFDVVKKLDGYYLEVMPDWRKEEGKDKRYSIIHLMDSNNGTMLTMYFFNNKLYAFMVSMYEGC